MRLMGQYKAQDGRLPPGIIAYLPPLAALALIVLLTVQPSGESGRFSQWFASQLIHWLHLENRPHWCVFIARNARRIGHVLEYFLLGLTVAAAFRISGRRGFLGALAVCAAVSLADQTLKIFIPGRHFDHFDLLMDLLGYGAAILLVLALSEIWKRKRRKHV